jgi:anhydro-N-acetylmuramic acid kinase
MSGTSMDGIDLAIVETDGETRVRRGPRSTVAYPEAFRRRLRQALADAEAMVRRDERPGSLAAIEAELTERHAEAVLRFVGDRMLQPAAIDIIGFHGQTVLHRPAQRLTVQLGDGPRLARLTGIDVAYDLRAADVAAGGQGAPLVPAYHRALAADRPERPIAFLNIGGIANLTWLGADGELIAFDTGPGNALIDDWMLARTGKALDPGGATAAAGRVEERVLAGLMGQPYFARPPPKSLDRGSFSRAPVEALALADGAATLVAFTAAAAEASLAHLPALPRLWIVTGGGRLNLALMAALRQRLGSAVVTAEAAGFDGDSMEAEAWGFLAVRVAAGLPLTFPGTTGVAAPTLGGLIARA